MKFLKKENLEVIQLFTIIFIMNLSAYIYLSYFPEKYHLNSDLAFNELSLFDNTIMILSGIIFIICIIFLFIKSFKRFYK